MTKTTSDMFILKKKDGKARRGCLITPHGEIETPIFMNVATCAAIKGGIAAEDCLRATAKEGMGGTLATLEA